MSALNVEEQVRWQDLRVKSELDIVFDIAKQEGWKDCEVFGYGAMITEPQESKGWKLIPADLYKDSIPPEAVERLHQIINAGIRVRGVIIADDQRRVEPSIMPAHVPAPIPAPTKPKVSLSFIRSIAAWTGKVLLGFVRLARAAGAFFRQAAHGFAHAVGAALSLSGKVLHEIIRVAGLMALAAGAIALVAGAMIILIPIIARVLIHYWGVIPIGLFALAFARAGNGTGTGARMKYDPKLVILVDDGEGGITWVSLYTWYD